MASSFTVPCSCGERFHAGGASIGRRVRCRCGRVVELQPPRVAARPARDLFHPPRSRKRGSLASRVDWLRRSTRVGPTSRRQWRAFVAATRMKRWLAPLSWAYLASMIAIAAAMWTLGDSWWPATVLLFMGRWIFLVPLALLLPLALALRPMLLLPLAVGAVVTLGPIMGGRVGLDRLASGVEGMPLRVVTYNADGGGTLVDKLPLLLPEWGADVVLVQECGEVVATVAEQIPGWHAHHAGDLCLLTRLPIVSVEIMDRSALERVKQDSRAGIGGAGYVARYTLQTSSGPIDVTNLHLETPRKGFEGLMANGDVDQLELNTTLRDIESSLARRWASAGSNPTIVAGDFNTPVESRIFQEHWGDLTNAFSRAGLGFGVSKYNGWIRIRIDHVLTDATWRPTRVRVWPDVGSDHRPVIADLVLLKR